MAIMHELANAGLVETNVHRVDGMTLAKPLINIVLPVPTCCDEALKKYKSAPAGKFNLVMGSQECYYKSWMPTVLGCIRDMEHAYSKDGGLAILKGNIAQDGCVVKTAGVDESIWKFTGPAKCSILKTLLAKAS